MNQNSIHRDALALPIYEKRAEIISALRQNQVVVVAGETGSGKTTQLPLFCLEAGLGRRGQIGCTQPRRIAATSIAARVAAQMGCLVGGRVGYKIRFAAKESNDTAVRFITDGILLTEVEHDRLFSRYDALIIDEAHERSLNIDFLLGYLRQILPRRPDLKIIISSATIDAKSFSDCFGNAPIINVSGRLYPIETLYRAPPAVWEGGRYVEDAVTAVTDIFDEYGPGGMLVFMPTERDIRETCDKLRGLSIRRGVMVLPLFARLTRPEQDAIFNPSDAPRVVVCTNIAETSVTVPDIRYVVDTGLARVSRYAPRLRTNRLPIEPISRASADQRKGRCGRVRDGVCVRLYTEEDFERRPAFTQPEIRRSNLAGVILTMAAQNIGAVEDFPFMEPPNKQAIAEGYAQLRELGAIDKAKILTQLGREMARFPFDPHISRMIIAAKKENALREVMIIAAGLSIVDPRERPLDKQPEADAMHAKFVDKSSDFLTYINLWNAYRDVWGTLKTQGAIRRFCRENFLSFSRLREWHDVHRLLDGTLAVMKNYCPNASPAPPGAVHRALLTGLLVNCAYLDKNGRYKGAGGKEVTIFPGSALAKKKCGWVMCHEIVETSRIFARTVAPIEPEWLEELGAEFCKHTFETPFFDAETGAVRATERVTIFGLPLAVRKNALYSRAEPELAADIFIREGLVEEKLDTHYRFYAHNKKLREKILLLEDKLRSRGYYSGDDAIFDFYKERLPSVSSVHGLNKVIKEKGGDGFLYIKEEELLNAAIPQEAENFPDHVNIGNKNFALKYAFAPGSAEDGVTLALPQKVLPFVAKETLGWLLPALWPDRIENLLRGLPRELRRALFPISETASRLAAEIDGTDTHKPFAPALSEAIKNIYGIDIDPVLLESEKNDSHLDLKIEVRDDENNVIARGRSKEIYERLAAAPANTPDSGGSPWTDVFNSYRKTNIVKWPDENLSEPVDAAVSGADNKATFKQPSLPVMGYPALVPNENYVKDGTDMEKGVDLVLFPSKAESDAAHRGGVRQLLELAVCKDLAWAEHDLSFSTQIKMMCAPFGTGDEFRQKLYDMLRAAALDFNDAPRSEEQFNALAAKTKESLRGAGFRALSVFEESLRIFADNVSRLSSAKKTLPPDIYKELNDELNGYFKDILSGVITLEIFLQYPRYLKTFSVIIEKAVSEPFKYRQKKAAVKQYRSICEALSKQYAAEENAPARKRRLNELSQMLREYEINLFAQHIKTLYPISEKRVDRKIEEIKSFNVK